MKNITSLLLILFLSLSCKSQDVVNDKKATNTVTATTNPKLVVGIVVDQMRYDYLTRFYDRFGEGGFKRMINEGFNCKNNHFNYIPTKTAAGHASIFTGTTPKYHGVIGNDWFDKELKKIVYCTGDEMMQSIGTTSKYGKMSPHRMKVTTFADENRLFTQMRGKTIGVSIKDRGAILPAGHTANAAYWFHGRDEGNWITSSFYMNALPKWVNDFNASGITKSYLKVWNTLYDINTYAESGKDLSTFEEGFKGKDTPTFPYDLNEINSENRGYDILKSTAYGNSLTTDFALAALDGEQLGKDNITDVLTLSFSATDYVGHNFGVISKEIEDTYLRLDKDLERFFKALDAKVGVGEYTVFLTADHGAPYVPDYLLSVKVPAGLFDLNKMKADLNTLLEVKYGVSSLILSTINNQIFLDHDKINAENLNLEAIKNVLVKKILAYKLIDKVYLDSEVKNHSNGNSAQIEDLLNNGYNQKRSGDILLVTDPSVFKDTFWNRQGTDHGTGFSYDTHVPLLFFGKGIKHGETLQNTNITDIAPTVSSLLGISFPNAAIGQPLEFVLD
ncbi:alkaline phosphatase PafA [Ichthyenterobacterium magnum]|uniref:glycerophosphocholine cholinephosphodiesterase n=1 Tax=Ichthyenterobacterium magnum TaxID=1230530 RepID=A0A420DFF0_9FLAO|nr:alkaline phosphatase PafA [Ichthyenterobacterium magnum]RKE90992.1 putative AlkP superfamily pyrophosphatase or phosphodiesterase [Ichthyenterobacterium magnum]